MIEEPKVIYFQRNPIKGFHFSVEIIFNDVRKYLPEPFGTKVWIAPYFSKGILQRMAMMVSAYLNQGDINHVTGDISFVGIGLNKKKTVQTILDCVFLKNRSGLAKIILKFFWLELPIKRAAIVTTISQQVKDEIVELTHCKASKVHVIPIALSDVFVERTSSPENEVPKILMIGNAPNKNWRNVLEALNGIACEVHVVAKQDEAIKSKLEELKFNYIYQSGLNQLQMLEKYNMMDLVLFASTYEGFGMPIIEAQAVGVPVITSNISSMPEVAGDGAIFVDPYDIEDIKKGVCLLLNDRMLREALVLKGKENIKRFNPTKIALQYAEIYQTILDHQ